MWGYIILTIIVGKEHQNFRQWDCSSTVKLNNRLTQLQCLMECYMSVVLQLVSISSPYWPYLLHSSYQTQTLDVLQIKWKISLLIMKIISINIIWKSEKGFHKQIWYFFIYIWCPTGFPCQKMLESFYTKHDACH